MYIYNSHTKKQISLWLLTIFIILSIMIIVGGLTRLTDSGLSITEWELFSGFLPPLTDQKWNFYFDLYKKIPEFKLQNYEMTLNDFKIIFWWEWGHRFLGRLIGLLFLIPLIYFSFKEKLKNLSFYYIIFLLICFQGFIGWYMVSSGLIDRVDVSHFRLSIHLLVAFIILSLVLWCYLNLTNIELSNYKIPYIPTFFVICVFTQIILGAFVSGMDAGKIYNTWPLMGSTFFPNDNNLINLFKLSAFSDPSLVQFMHRNFAYLILAVYLLMLFISYKYNFKRYYKTLVVLGVVLLIQIILGIFTVLYGAQIFLASMHQISSIFLVSSTIYLFYINTKIN
ncbi:MAG: COX15/CtaA family protein [Candidatus Pelagibacter sp.]